MKAYISHVLFSAPLEVGLIVRIQIHTVGLLTIKVIVAIEEDEEAKFTVTYLAQICIQRNS